MKKRIQEITNNNFVKFQNWIDSINQFEAICFSTEKLNELELHRISIETAQVFADVLHLFVEAGNFKDTWEKPTFNLFHSGLQSQIVSVKMNESFIFGIDQDGLFLQSYISKPGNLRYMNDNFWRSILELSDLGQWEFNENEAFTDEVERKHPQLFKTSKGNMFRLLRNYFLSEIEFGESMDLGWLTVRWTKDHDIHEVFTNGCQAFKTLYNLNYELWKVSDLKRKKFVGTK